MVSETPPGSGDMSMTADAKRDIARPRDFGERLAGIEMQMEHVATREDIQKIKVWFLVGVIAAIGVAVPAAIGVAFAAVRLFVP